MTPEEARIAIATIKRVAETLDVRLQDDGNILSVRGWNIDLTVIETATQDLREFAEKKKS